MALPPLPDGFKLEENKPAAPAMPALPEGFRLESEVPDLPTATQPPPMEEQAQQGRFGDFVDQTQRAFLDSFASDAQAIDYLADSETAGRAADYLYEKGEQAASTLSDQAIEGASKKWVNDDGSLGDAWGDVDSWIGLAASGAGSLGAVIAGGGLTKAAVTIGVRGMAKKMGKDVLEKGSKGDKVVGALAYGSQEGLMMGGSAGKAVEEEILAMPVELLVEAPAFQGAFEEMLNAGMSETEAAQAAKETVARSAAVSATKGAGAVGVMLGTVAGKFIDDALSKRIAGGAAKGAGVGALVEGGTEAAQGGSQQAIQNLNIATVDPNQEIMEGVANAAVSEGLAGGMAGGVLGAGSGALTSAPVDLTQETGVETESEVVQEDPVATEEEIVPPEMPPEVTQEEQLENLIPVAGNKMSRGDRQQLEREREELAAARNRVEATPEPVTPQKDVPARRAKQQAQQEAESIAQQEREMYQERIDRIDQTLSQDDEARAAFGDISRIEQGLDPQSDQQFKPLQDIEIKQVFNVEETGEQVEISERADRLFSRIDKRRNVLTKLLECVG